MKPVLQRVELVIARRAERRALEQLGATLPPSPQVAACDARIAELTAALPLSLERDRLDWAAVPMWARWFVALRGVFDRLVLRALRHGARIERAAACAALALASIDTAKGGLADAARVAHWRAGDAEVALKPLPGAVMEAHHFGRALWKEGKGQLLPRLPGLAGLGAGWWIAQTFTDSGFSAMLHSFGFGSGPRHVVSHDTLKAMSFWLPLLAAAVCSYAGMRLSALVQSRYGAPERQR